jgi:mRNA interferase MazF
VTIAPITTTVRGIPSEIVLTEQDGMPKTCAINLDHVQTVSKGRLGALLTTLSTIRMEHVRSALLFALGFRT